jgi:hypothetical protein
MHVLQDDFYWCYFPPPLVGIVVVVFAAAEVTPVKVETRPRNDSPPSVHAWDLRLESVNRRIRCVAASFGQISVNQNTPSDAR